MKKLIWGIVLIVLAIPSLRPNHNHEPNLLAAPMLIVGSVLAYQGWSWNKRSKQVVSIALQMIREEGKLDAQKLAYGLGLSEIEVRKMIVEAQRTGVIGFKTEII